MSNPSSEDIAVFQQLLDQYRYDFVRLAFIIFPFGEKGTDLEHMMPYEWQIEEWRELSSHLSNPATRYHAYRLIISSGNGAAKTAFGAMTTLMIMYTQKLRARMTANTDPQMKSIIWPEYDLWFRRARFHDVFFEKFGTSIKAKKPELSEIWRIDTVTWAEESPASISGLHNKGNAILYTFEEAPGIPAVIWDYTRGAFSETETIKLFLAFGNSDDPESKFEQNMTSPLWRAVRIDTRKLKHIDKKFIADILTECGGNEDHDEFRVRIRGLPRKTSKDSIISMETVAAAIERGRTLDRSSLKSLPVILTCDPAWTGGDETTVWYQQGPYRHMLEKYKLDKAAGQDHMFTYLRMCHWERTLGADAIFIDQGEGTALYTLANNAGKHWELVAFGATPNDTPEFKDSQYSNIRAQMYYETNDWLMKGGALGAENPEWLDVIQRQLCWTKGGRHKVHNKKIAEPKLDIKKRVGQSPDVADGCILCSFRQVTERLPENDSSMSPEDRFRTGQGTYKMPSHEDPYDEEQYRDTYASLYN